MVDAPVIETDRLRLRPLGIDDLDDIHRIWTDPAVRKYLWDDRVISEDEAASMIGSSVKSFESSGFGLWGVRAREANPLVGFCGYWQFYEPPQLELMFGIAPEHWGKGLATEAARAMIRYGFEELGLERVLASTDVPNEASVRVMEKSGMAFVRRARVKGLDLVFYETSRESFRRHGAPGQGGTPVEER